MISANFLATAAAIVSFYAASAKAANYATYPSVAHTATINGFADPIYGRLPECAKSCVEEDTDSTPCPYWDPGCLCVMSNWGAPVAECIAESCKGSDVSDAAGLATSICSSAGVPSPYWYIPASDSAALSSAAEATATEDASSSAAETSAAETSAAETSAAETSAAETSAAETSAPETSAPAETSAPETSAPAQTSAPETSAPAESASAPVESASATDAPEVEAQENSAVFNVPGPALIALSAISFAAFYF
ncbi:unnamed protein product [Debaryomyces tyrocola]|nr:unnamed protein product [Debaryomyces tyrocola]